MYLRNIVTALHFFVNLCFSCIRKLVETCPPKLLPRMTFRGTNTHNASFQRFHRNLLRMFWKQTSHPKGVLVGGKEDENFSDRGFSSTEVIYFLAYLNKPNVANFPESLLWEYPRMSTPTGRASG
jgi:hypothetical protein